MEVDVDVQSLVGQEAHLPTSSLLKSKLARDLEQLIGRVGSTAAELGVPAEDGVAHGRAGQEDDGLERHDGARTRQKEGLWRRMGLGPGRDDLGMDHEQQRQDRRHLI